MKAVLDIGKTNVKLSLMDNNRLKVASFSRKNNPIYAASYPHADVAGIWGWLVEVLNTCPYVKHIAAFIVTTHGATAALVNEDLPGDGLVLPVVDYEFSGIDSCNESYEMVRPEFTETLSPALPAGLNLGRQLFWLEQNFPDQFACASHLLMYPQYWGWRLTGQMAAEVTSLGCHTDLWAPLSKHYSSLVARCNWERLMPPLKPAWQELASINAQVAAQTGLSIDCKVYVGLHDSNASYSRYLLANHEPSSSFTVISTGTWTVLMQANGDLAALRDKRDTLANCDISGEPVACARFMGGREYELICQRLGSDINAPVHYATVQTAINYLWMVTPDFSDGNGPFAGMTPIISCPQTAASAVATLYYALMIDQRLTDLQSTGPVYIEGAILKNSLLCSLVAQLRTGQAVYLSTDDTGTVQGALLLTLAKGTPVELELDPCLPADFKGLIEYQTYWLGLFASHLPAYKVIKLPIFQS
ncbi:MAG: FGGY family carbohydrate kinase [Pseudomonadota bacterium]